MVIFFINLFTFFVVWLFIHPKHAAENVLRHFGRFKIYSDDQYDRLNKD